MQWELLMVSWWRRWNAEDKQWQDKHSVTPMVADGNDETVVKDHGPGHTFIELGKSGWELVSVETERIQYQANAGLPGPHSQWTDRTFWFKRPRVE